MIKVDYRIRAVCETMEEYEQVKARFQSDPAIINVTEDLLNKTIRGYTIQTEGGIPDGVSQE